MALRVFVYVSRNLRGVICPYDMRLTLVIAGLIRDFLLLPGAKCALFHRNKFFILWPAVYARLSQ